MLTALPRFFTLCAVPALLSLGCGEPTDEELAEGPTVAADVEIYEDGPAPEMPSSMEAALSTTLIHEHFNYDQPLITNEYATYNPSHAGIIVSPIWKVTSGSLFHSSGTGYTGKPDDVR